MIVSASERSQGQELHAYSCFGSAISASAFCHAAGRAGVVHHCRLSSVQARSVMHAHVLPCQHTSKWSPARAAAVASGGRVAVISVDSTMKEEREGAIKMGGMHGVSALHWGRSGKLLTACTTVRAMHSPVPGRRMH